MPSRAPRFFNRAVWAISPWLLSAAWLGFGAKLPVPPPAGPDNFTSAVRAIVKQYCFGCHSGDTPSAGLNLAAALNKSAAGQSEVWTKVATNVASGHMPPEGVPHPSTAERAKLKGAVENLIASECRVAQPAHVTIRRLNRAEYDNTIRDLIGLDLHLSKDFPSDDVGYGFDNIGDVLSTSPLLMEKYLNAAELISQAAIAVPERPYARIDGSQFKLAPGATLSRDGDVELFTVSIIHGDLQLPIGGEYKLEIAAYGDEAGPEPAKMDVAVDGRLLTSFNVSAKAATSYIVPCELSAGKHDVAIKFTNDYYDAATKADRNLYVSYVECKGGAAQMGELSAAHVRLIPHQVEAVNWKATSRLMLKPFLTRAFRRPVTANELERLGKVFDAAASLGGSFEQGMRSAVAAVLVSPNFLFRVERNTVLPSGKPAPLDNYELASRLSYFLWSSMPDDRLLELAGEGKLSRPDILKTEIKRMLSDPKREGLAKNFADQWLQLRKLATLNPDPATFPTMDATLKADMTLETEKFFDSVVGEDRSVIDFLNGDYTFINDRLATLYGIAGVSGPEFRRVTLTDPNRAGLLTQGSILAVTSNPTRTSPTKRGKWVLEEFLDTPPPPPPPGVGALKDERHALSNVSLKKLMEEHRKNPICASCHAKMDPIGFGLENFDAIGRWRTQEPSGAIDATGILPDGTKFSGPIELRKILLKSKPEFVRCLADKLMTFALGRGLTAADACVLDDVVKQTSSHGYRFSALVEAIVLSDTFRLGVKGNPTK